jgi:hypothetical protein
MLFITFFTTTCRFGVSNKTGKGKPDRGTQHKAAPPFKPTRY